MKIRTKKLRLLILAACVVGGLFLLNIILQNWVAHWTKPFVPDYARLDLRPTLESGALSDRDYADIFLQTGLAKPGVDGFLKRGDLGVELILAAQEAFFHPPQTVCTTLIPTTMEERLHDESGALTTGAPLAPLQDGDILVALSTHTAGWRHGHAGLVVDAARGVTLEAPALGSSSALYDVSHWNTYATYVVLRPRTLSDAQRDALLAFATGHLLDIPYSLTVGMLGGKALDPSGVLSAHCAYLPWYAYMQIGMDLDSDGGIFVTVNDLLHSPLLEVVQVYGINPADFR